VVPPVVENVFGIAGYAIPVVVAYRHVAGSFVVRPIVVCVVPAASTPEGWSFERSGGVVSTGGLTVSETMATPDVD
jgi:hypothetical protein